MAKERARISGRKAETLSPLEQAAKEWEAEKKKFEEEIPIPLTQVPLGAIAKEYKEDTEVIWKVYKPPEEGKKEGVRLNAAAISALAMHLRAVEWARAMRRVRQYSRAQRLE